MKCIPCFGAVLLMSSSLLSGCASSYVLHWKPKADFLDRVTFDLPEESSPLAQSEMTLLLYDRTPFVPLEMPKKDGKVWVHYAINIKNASTKAARVSMKDVVLKDADGRIAHAVYDRADHIDPTETVARDVTYRASVRFLLARKTVEQHEDGGDPLTLHVPVNGHELKLKLWLWEE